MNLQNKIVEVQLSKNDIKDALIAKGEDPTDDISTYAELISRIPITNSTNLTVNPSLTTQTIFPPAGYTGFYEVNVNSVNSSIDRNIREGSIKEGVGILGVTGNASGLNGQNMTVTTNGTYTPTGNYNGISSITVNVPSTNITREISPTGVFQKPTSSFTFSLPSTVTDIGDNALWSAFSGCSNLTSVDLSSLTTVSGYKGLHNAFSGCSNLTSVDLSSLTTISGGNGLYGAFQNCTSLTSVDLSSLTTVSGGSALLSAFQNCTSLTSVDLSSLTTVSGSSSLLYAFKSCTNLTSVDLSSLTDVSGSESMYSAFSGCSSLTSVDLSSLTTVSGINAFRFAFNGCSNLTSVDLSSLTTVSGSSGLATAFANCTSLTSVDFSSLTTVSGAGALQFAFDSCSNLTSVDLSSLTTISGSGGLSNTFNYCTSLQSLSFPALTADSFGSYTNQFNKMLQGVSGCTVHFPSNLQSVIGSWSDVTNGFGGTNTTVLFDLPSTGPAILTVKISGSSTPDYLTLNGESKPTAVGTYTYEYPRGTEVYYEYRIQYVRGGTYIMDQDQELKISYIF